MNVWKTLNKISRYIRPIKVPGNRLQVLMEYRSGTTRKINNIMELHKNCQEYYKCNVYSFNKNRPLAHELKIVKSHNVFVGMHGAGFSNSFFMKKGSFVVEVRPYGFEGEWPDMYFKKLMLAPYLYHMQISIANRSQCVPLPHIWEHPFYARNRNCNVSWSILLAALQQIDINRRNKALWPKLAWTNKIFVSN